MFKYADKGNEMTYAEVLRHYLKERGMTSAEIAYAIGVPRSSIHYLLTGKNREPTLGRAKAIADALGVTLQEMVDMMGQG